MSHHWRSWLAGVPDMMNELRTTVLPSAVGASLVSSSLMVL